MPKLPYMKFFPGDWIRDTRPLSLAAKGAWIDLICIMWDTPTPGKITMNIVALSRAIGASAEQATRVLDELKSFGICEHREDCNGNVTITCRRIERDNAEREKSRQRVARHRAKKSNTDDGDKANTATPKPCNGASNGKVTPYSPESIVQKPKRNLPLPPPGDPLATEMSGDFQTLAEHWKSLGQVLDLRSREGIRALIALGRPLPEVQSVLTAFLKARKKAKPDDWLSSCTLKGLADGHYSDFAETEKKPDRPKQTLIRGECPQCGASISARASPEKDSVAVTCMNPQCGEKFTISRGELV